MNIINAENLIQRHIADLAETLAYLLHSKKDILQNLKIEMENIDKLKKMNWDEKVDLKRIDTDYGSHFKIIEMKVKK